MTQPRANFNPMLHSKQILDTLCVVLEAHLPLELQGTRIQARQVWQVLCDASVHQTSIEASCQRLALAPSGNRLREVLPPVLRAHRKLFGHAPRMLAGDRGVFSPDNEDLARQLGVAQIVLPQRGYRTAERRAYEKQRWFKNGLRFRNGIEGRISVLRRTVQLRRCPYRGLDGFERWVGWGVLVANLTVMARIHHKRHTRKRVRKK